MEGCKALGSKTMCVPTCSITSRASGIFTNSCRQLVNANNTTTRLDTRPPVNENVRSSAAYYDVYLSSRPCEVKGVNDAETFKESFVMVKNIAGRYVLPENCKPKFYKKKECKLEGNCNYYNDIPKVDSDSGHLLSSEEFKVKTPVMNEFKSNVKEEFNPSFVLTLNTNDYVPDSNGILSIPGSPAHFSWPEFIKANPLSMDKYKSNVKGHVHKSNNNCYMQNRYITVPILDPNSKGTEKKEFNPYAKEWIPKKNVKNMSNCFGSSTKGKTLETKLIAVKVKASESKLMDEKQDTRVLMSKESQSNDKNLKAIKKDSLGREECTLVGVNRNISNNTQMPNFSKISINTSSKDAKSGLRKNENGANFFVEDIYRENKKQDTAINTKTVSRIDFLLEETRKDLTNTIDKTKSASSILKSKKSEGSRTFNGQEMNKTAKRVDRTADYSDIVSNTKNPVPFVVGAPVYRLKGSLIKRPVKINDITDEVIIYKGNEKEKVRKAIEEANTREKEEINNASSLKVDMSFAQLMTVRETIENIKRSNGLFMFSSGVTTINMTNTPIWTGLHWVSEPSRWLCVSNFPFEPEYYPDLRLLFEAYGDVREIHCGSNGIAYVFYYDIRDAIKAQNLLKHKEAPHNRGRLNVRFGQRPTNISNLMHLYPPVSSQELQNEGSLIISYYGAYASEPTIKARFNKYGTIKDFGSQAYEDVRVITLEYYDSRNANSAKKSLNGQKVQGAILAIEFYDPSAQSWDIVTNEISGRQKPPKPTTKIYPSPPATSTVHSSGNRTIPLRNRMNLEKVRQGLDVRTTFMVRNIPNKYTQEMLLAELNETHKGKYDFLYLRIDFANKCNVGYAFINFVDINAVISFAESRVGRKWACFNSDKICELSYADVQGYPALVEKFRTSSIMRERPEYRPKVFFTSGPMKGTEAPFPSSSGRK